MAAIFKRKRSKFWYVKYYVNGQQVSFPKTPSALFYKHFRLVSAMLFTATIEPFQPERTASSWT